MRLFARPAALPALVLLLLVLRWAWQAFASDLTLLEDEAHYWEWSRCLDWSYYTKGPGVAWVIRASTELLGTSEWSVRLPALISTALGMLGAATAARWAFPGRREIETTSALLFALVPGFAIAAMLMTIDAPYVACWIWAGAFALRAITTGSPRAWLALGACVAIGFLFKYTILLILPGVALAMLATRGRRPATRPAPVLAAGLVACLGLLPVLVWNAQHEWATLRHLLGHLGVAGGDVPAAASENWSPLWAPEYLLLQAFVCGPVLTLAWMGWRRARNDGTLRTPFAVLGSIALPIFAFYLLVSLKAQTEGNWAMAGAATLAPLAAWAAVDGVQRHSHPIRFFWGAALIIGLICLMLFPAMGWASQRRIIGPLIPVARVTGMRDHALAVHEQLDAIHQRTGQPPTLWCDHYGRASQLAYYLPGRPTVYCAQHPLGGRRTQYDVWPDTDPTNADAMATLLGRPALLLGRPDSRWETAFEGLTDLGPLPGEPKPNERTALAADRFVGFAAPSENDPATDPARNP